MADEAPPVAPGLLTSEFWLTVLGVAAMVVLTLMDKVSGEVTTAAIAAACFGYQASRAVVKKAAVGSDATLASFRADLATLAEESKPPARRRASSD